MKFLYWLLPFLLYPLPLRAQGMSSVITASSVTLFQLPGPRPQSLQKLERETVKALLQVAPQIGKDEKARREVAIALARFGATDAALVIARNKAVQNDVRQMAGLRAIFMGTTENARRWILELPASHRPYLHLQLARRFLLEKRREEALEILRLIPLPDSTSFAAVLMQGDVAVAFAEAGDKAQTQKRFDSLDALYGKLAAGSKEGKQVAGAERGFLIFYRLLAGVPLSASQVVAQGRSSIVSALGFYFDANQEDAAKRTLELLPPEEALNIVSSVAPVESGEKINALRQKIVREWLAKTPVDKRALFVEREAQALAHWGDVNAGLELIEEFLAPGSRKEAKDQLRLSVLTDPRSAAKVAVEVRRRWATQLLPKLLIERRQQLRDPEKANNLDWTLTQIFEVALVLGQNQTAQIALYEREKLLAGEVEYNEFGDEGDEHLRENLFASDWERAGNVKRAALWRQKIQTHSAKTDGKALSRIRDLIRRQRPDEAAALLPQVSKREWEKVGDEELSSIVGSIGFGQAEVLPKEPPRWFENLSTPAQKMMVLSRWVASVAPWDIMRWARVDEKMR